MEAPPPEAPKGTEPTGTGPLSGNKRISNRCSVPLHNLASRYGFRPLISEAEDEPRIAAFHEESFRQNGPPPFLKRDNGNPFNNQHVDAVLARHVVPPLNSPPQVPRYNGAMTKGIGDLKRRLDQRLSAPVQDQGLIASVEATVHELNHRPHRCLQGRVGSAFSCASAAISSNDGARMRLTLFCVLPLVTAARMRPSPENAT
jgi:transposase InsO family protein